MEYAREQVKNRVLNLSQAERARVQSTIERISTNTGQEWRYEVMKGQGQDEAPLLEIIVEGRMAKPVRLSPYTADPSQSICDALMNHAIANHQSV